MQNSNFKIIIAAFFIMMCGVEAQAGVLDLSRIGMGAKSLSLGRAQVAGSDLGAAFINPAVLADFDSFSLTSMYSNVSEDVMYNMLGVAFPLREGMYGCLGIGYVGAVVSGISVTTSEVRTGAVSSTDYSNRLLMLSYGRDLNAFVQIGATAKFLTRAFESVQNGSAAGTDLDVGFLIYPKDNVKAGLSLQNILNTQLSWKGGENEDISSNVKMGVGIKANKQFSILLDYDSNQYFHSGIEWHPKEFLSIRGGVERVPTSNKESILNYSLGVGLAVKGFSFDYAYYLDTLLASNSSHFMSISYTLPEKTLESRPILPANKENNEVSFN